MPPDCTIYTSLPYSVHAFEHLEGMKDREKLTGTPELGLKNAITYQDNVDEYGHRIYEAFKQVTIRKINQSKMPSDAFSRSGMHIHRAFYTSGHFIRV